MPRYYFDLFEDDRLMTDDEGVELRDLYEAREQAQRLLPDITRDVMPDGDSRAFTVLVRCSEKRIRLQATLSMRSVWIEAPDGSVPKRSSRL